MAETASVIVDSILRRLRDPLGEAHPRSLVLDIYSRVQVALNAARGYVLADFSLRTVPGKPLYTMDGDINGLQRVTTVEVGNVHIDEVIPWRNLWKLSPTWYTDAGSVQGWAMVGLGLFAVYPVPSVSETLQLRGPKITPMLTEDDEPISFRSEDADIARDLTVALLLLRWRDLDMVQQITQIAGERMNLHIAQTVMEEAR